MSKIKVNHKDPLAYYEIANFVKDYMDKDTVIVCIGTDRCIGDAVGPLVGTILKQNNFPYPVYGTIDEPMHALNIERKLEEIKTLHPNARIIGIDACLGNREDIGEIQARDYPIHPGKGVGKSLPDVGIISVIGIVDSSDSNELFASRNIRLSLIFSLSNKIVDGLVHAAYLVKNLNSEREVI